MPTLSRYVAVLASLKCENEGFVVRANMKCTTLEKISEVLNSKVNGQPFPIKRAVTSFCWLELFGEKRDGLPLSINVLLQHCTYGRVGGIGHDISQSMWFWVG